MKILINKRKYLLVLLILLTIVWLVPSVFAAPQADGFVPTPTRTPTVTLTLVPTALPPATNTPTTIPYPAAPTQAGQAPTDTPIVATNTSGNSNVPETNNTSAAAAGSSVLGFLLCTGLIIVAGLAILNVWARRRP